MKTIGLTGGIATGKSTVARLLSRAGVPVVDADQLSRQVVAPGAPALAEIAEAFGDHLVGPDGALDRKALGAVVSRDAGARKRLEAITHPRIFAAMAEALDALRQEGAPVAVVEAALMVETGSFRLYDGVVLVTAPRAVRLARLQARDGFSAEEAARWIDLQLPVEEKARRLREAEAQGGPALAVIDNGADLQALADAVAAAWEDLCTRVGAQGAPRLVPGTRGETPGSAQ